MLKWWTSHVISQSSDTQVSLTCSCGVHFGTEYRFPLFQLSVRLTGDAAVASSQSLGHLLAVTRNASFSSQCSRPWQAVQIDGSRVIFFFFLNSWERKAFLGLRPASSWELVSALPAGSSAGPAGTLLLCSLLLSSASYPSERVGCSASMATEVLVTHTPHSELAWVLWHSTTLCVCVCSQKYISLLSCVAYSCLASSLLSLLEFSTTFVVAFQVCLWSYRDICGFIYFLRGEKKSASLHSHSGKI